MEFTKEQFDKLATKEDLKAYATKAELTEALQNQTADLMNFTNTKFDELTGIISKSFGELSEHVDVREQIERHERDLEKIKSALKLA